MDTNEMNRWAAAAVSAMLKRVMTNLADAHESAAAELREALK